MNNSSIEKLRYPIGRFTFNHANNTRQLKKWIKDIELCPSLMKKATQGLRNSQINTRYRPDGWTVKQVVHHVADSHMNAYIRLKLSLSENIPTIKPYEESLWAEMDDAKKLPVRISLLLLEALHIRWVHVLKNMKPEDFNKKYFHPESNREITLFEFVSMYAWHSKHHVAHVRIVSER